MRLGNTTTFRWVVFALLFLSFVSVADKLLNTLNLIAVVCIIGVSYLHDIAHRLRAREEPPAKSPVPSVRRVLHRPAPAKPLPTQP